MLVNQTSTQLQPILLYKINKYFGSNLSLYSSSASGKMLIKDTQKTIQNYNVTIKMPPKLRGK